jgi:hypothetical protein
MMLSVILLGVAFYLLLSERYYVECRYAACCYAACCYAECRYAECRYTECRYAECRYAECRRESLGKFFKRIFQNHFKAVSTGLVYGDHAYFKSGWNVMDGSLVSGL